MADSYDNRTAHWDPSILGITPDTWARMDSEEREAFLRDSLHRAADLSSAIVRAFAADLTSDERSALVKASRLIQGIARSRT